MTNLNNIGSIVKSDPLVKLIQKENFVGWVYRIDYDRAYVMTNDIWKQQVLGIPHNCFLVAASFDPDHFDQADEFEKEVILLRVLRSAPLPQDDELVKTRIDYYQEQTNIYGGRELDSITQNQLQFGGLECKVLGTFFNDEGHLRLGSDLESFINAARLAVYRPRKEALKIIVNYVDPDRRRRAEEEAEQLGFKKKLSPFVIGTVRYTSTDRMHRRMSKDEEVEVSIQPADFLARRTAVLGMTRTGKSNMIKQLVSVIKRVSDESEVPIGQIIYDINGEYANANQQDQGALADVYPDDTIRYRMIPSEGFEILGTNFYEQVEEGFAIIRRELEKRGRLTSDYLAKFVKVNLEKPDDPKDYSELKRWERKVSAYKALLFKAGFKPPSKQYRVKFSASKEVLDAVERVANRKFPDPQNGFTLEEAVDWFLAVRKADREGSLPKSKSGKKWVDEELAVLLNMLAQKNDNDAFISGYSVVTQAIGFHIPNRNRRVEEEIYDHLKNGKIVILDLSVGDPEVREQIAKDIAAYIFNASMQIFINGKMPPNICVYIEEAHNLIGKDMELTEVWPRLAKEGGKYRIALIYATQEVSSVHPNILANTENWFVTHLNNENEIKHLARFYDFEDFSRSLLRAQDVGFARVKMLSGPFVIPVQINKFDPEKEKNRRMQLKRGY